jgi:hypothetical protein
MFGIGIGQWRYMLMSSFLHCISVSAKLGKINRRNAANRLLRFPFLNYFRTQADRGRVEEDGDGEGDIKKGDSDS